MRNQNYGKWAASVVAAMLFGSCLSISERAWADDSLEKAKAAFEEGKQKFRDKDFEGAAKAFKEANRHRPNWKLYYNIGQCEAAAKRYGLAIEAFERYTVEGGDEISEERQAELLVELERLRAKTGELKIKAPRGAAVTVDGVVRGVTPLPGTVRVAAGIEHELLIELEEDVLLERVVRVGAKSSMAIEIPDSNEEEPTPQPVEPPPVQATVQEDNGASKIKTTGWVLFATGAAAAIAGGVTGGLALSKEGDLDDACTPKTQCPDDQKDLHSQAEGLANASSILLPVGGVMVATGVIMVVVGYKKEKENKVSLLPVMTADGGGLVLKGRF